jgi:hypothetical protein
MDGRRVHWLSSGCPKNFTRAVRPYITAEDYNHIERILLDGCPAELMFTESLDNKLKMIERGNSKSFDDHPELVKKAMNKEDRYSHLVPIDEDICLHLLTSVILFKQWS